MAVKHIQISKSTKVFHANCSLVVKVNYRTGKFKIKKLESADNATPDDIKEAYNFASQYATQDLSGSITSATV
jgi:hypothetical protein